MTAWCGFCILWITFWSQFDAFAGLEVSLFGGLFKVLGKVVKSGLSVVTHGVSDEVIDQVGKVLKGRGQAKQVLAKGPDVPATNNEVATVRKLLPAHTLVRPNIEDAVLRRVGGAVQQSGVEGYSSGGKRSRKGMAWKTKSKRRRSAPAAEDQSTSASGGRTRRRRKAGGGGSSSKPKRSLNPAMRARANAMRELAARWRSEGKPGRWIDYVKANL